MQPKRGRAKGALAFGVSVVGSGPMPRTAANLGGQGAVQAVPQAAVGASSVRRAAVAAYAPANRVRGLRSLIERFFKGRLRQLGLLGKRGRQYIVENLYSRVLYTFSDVIVFVLPAENKNTIENVTLQLLEWASKAIHCSSNQPCLPHAVIVLNKSDPSLPDEDWDPITSTKWLFAGLERQLDTNLKFKPFVATLKGDDRRRTVGAHELLECYYSSVQVVRVPAFADGAGRPKLIQQQMNTLYRRLSDCCVDAREQKRERRMLLTADQFSPYIQLAFDHFSSSGLDKGGFDFIQASFLNRPVFPNLADNIVAIARPSLKMRKDGANHKHLKAYFEDLSRPVASALMFDAARNERMGKAEYIFPQYREACEEALGIIMSKLWPCAAQNCSNVRDGHKKGHQMSSGKVIGAGKSYSPTLGFTEHAQKPIFLRLIRENLHTMLGQISDISSRKKGLDLDAGELSEARKYHKRIMFEFLADEAPAVMLHLNFRDNIGCLLCLFGSAAHALPCGHVLCSECVQSYGLQRSPDSFEITECPLHAHRDWPKPVSIRYKPALAGVRVLSIDGGGIRGIMQLAVLEDLEREFRGDIPIQCFFDLAVGTSIGGIIAIGLFVRGWSVKTCIEKLELICKEAFTPRFFADYLAWLRLIYYRYQTKPLEDALKREFGDQRLFGDSDLAAEGLPFDTKVAITAASPSAGSYVLANYNRLQQGATRGMFLRMSYPDDEFKLWEVARSTSAAPTWFEQYHHKPSGRVLLDGGIYHNNPILVAKEEHDSIWPGAPLDFVVSLGTGSAPATEITSDTEGSDSQIRNLGRVAFHKLMNSLDAERTWDDHMYTLAPRDRERHIRLNTPLSSPLPELDAVDQIGSLKSLTQHHWAIAERKKRIRNLARRMVASSFYFEMVETGSDSLNSGKASGTIRCRLDNSKRENVIKHLGEYFDRQAEVSNGTRPAFKIKESSSGCGGHITTIKIVNSMFTQQSFELDPMPITVETNDASCPTAITLAFGRHLDAQFPISGFPRCLFEAGG